MQKAWHTVGSQDQGGSAPIYLPQPCSGEIQSQVAWARCPANKWQGQICPQSQTAYSSRGIPRRPLSSWPGPLLDLVTSLHWPPALEALWYLPRASSSIHAL